MPNGPRQVTEISDLGHNDRLVVGDRQFDVQTEVLGRGPWRVRSTVIERGMVVHVTTSALSAGAGDVAAAARDVQAQHDAVLHQLKQRELL